MREYARKRGYLLFFAQGCAFSCAALVSYTLFLSRTARSWSDYALICPGLFNAALCALAARDYCLETRRVRSEVVRGLATSHRQRTVALRQGRLEGESAVVDVGTRADPRHLCVPTLRELLHG